MQSTILTMASPLLSRQVAVIGAGASGLVVSRELRREGLKTVVFERQSEIGGTWVYDDRVESDPLSLDRTRSVVHTSLYKSLRTNLPREAMGFRDFPFIPRNDKTRDARRYPGHREVLLYLRDFAREFELEEMVRFETEVLLVELVEDLQKWKVRSKKKKSEDVIEEIYDAVVVCNGHYFEPNVAQQIPGISSWPGKQLHSHNYRVPEPYRDQVVVLIGNSYSCSDICAEIASVAKEVHIVSRAAPAETYELKPGFRNIWIHSMIESVGEDGFVSFQNARRFFADTIIHCTGYKYGFPFLRTNGIVNVDDNRVEPLFGHVFPPALAPWLSFVGLPWKVSTFPIFELQSIWVARALSGRILLPSREKMMEETEAFYCSLEASNIPKRYTHALGDSQYDEWLGTRGGFEGFEEWRDQMYWVNANNHRLRPTNYRDEWDDDHLIVEAYKDFEKYKSKGFEPLFKSVAEP